jgi:hypothetical protein
VRGLVESELPPTNPLQPKERNMNQEEIRLVDIDSFDQSAQTRHELRQGAIDEYAEVYRSGVELDDVVAYEDGPVLYLSCGFHRREAQKRCGRAEIKCIVRQGDRLAALEAGIADNMRHRGERLTNRDKRHNVRLFLKLLPDASNELIAEKAQVSASTVRNYRPATPQNAESTLRQGRDGRVTDVSKIGHPKGAEPEETSTITPPASIVDTERWPIERFAVS